MEHNMACVKLALFLLIVKYSEAKTNTSISIERGFTSILSEKLEDLFVDYAVDITKWLETINDEHYNGEMGRLLRYKEIKPNLEGYKHGRGMKKMSMVMMPLIFQLGASSTWIALTGLLAAKSVAIGVLLLIFKIAVSSAKMASFFTSWKGKNSDHHDWSWSPPHHDHHDSYHADSSPQSSMWQPEEYHTISIDAKLSS